ncbi:MAG: gliding motility-associated C-terminal domain-containing protein [Flavobacteriales bacterium]
MNDGLNELLRQRFDAHEVPAPQDAWAQISGKLSAHADGTQLRETLQQKFQGHEAPVNSSAWANVSGRIRPAGVPSTYRWIAGGVAALAIGALFLWNTRETAELPQQPQEAVTAPAVTPARTNSTVEVPLPAQPLVEKVLPPTVKKIPASKPEHVELPSVMATTKPSSPVAEEVAEEARPEFDAAQVPVQEPPVTEPTQTSTQNQQPTVEASQPEQTVQHETIADIPSEAKPEPSAPLPAFQIYIPSAFTVNGDGVNDKLRIVADEYEAVEVLITTTGGVQVFRCNDLSRMWDGRMLNGNSAPDGLYHCLVSVSDLRGAVHYKTEVIRLFR